MNYLRYPKCKPSGVEWLGDVPEHWVIISLKRKYKVVNGGTPSSDEESYWDGDITWITPEDLGKTNGKKISESRRRITTDGLNNSGAQLVPSGSIIISTRAPIGHVAICHTPASTNQGCRSLVPISDSAIADFLYYVLVAFRDVLQAHGKGTTFMELAAGALGSHFVPMPRPDEQRMIADYLDRETAKIDALVAKKRELIEKLKEKRTALISRTVTRGLPPDTARAAGLDPNPKLKPSGIDWLGDVPEHWAMPPLYARYSVELGKMLNESRITGDHLVPYLRNVDVQWGYINYSELPEMDIPEYEYVRYTIKRGDLLVCEGGEVGRAAIVEQIDSVIGYQKALHRLRALSSHEAPRFMFYVLYWAANTGIFSAGGISTIAHLTCDQLRKYRFPKPPIREQRAIADYLDRETMRLDALIEKVQVAIDRLQEYRTALITAAVTGKIDVREAAA